jgi:hypothetical protein
MMKQLAAASALALTLSACQPVGTLPVAVQTVIADAQGICGVVANVEDVTALISGLVPGLDTAESVANLICTGVAALPTARFRATGGPTTVHVYLHGKTYVVRVK